MGPFDSLTWNDPKKIYSYIIITKLFALINILNHFLHSWNWLLFYGHSKGAWIATRWGTRLVWPNLLDVHGETVQSINGFLRHFPSLAILTIVMEISQHFNDSHSKNVLSRRSNNIIDIFDIFEFFKII